MHLSKLDWSDEGAAKAAADLRAFLQSANTACHRTAECETAVYPALTRALTLSAACMHQPQHDSSDLGLSPLGDAATGADVKQAFVQSRHRGKPTQCVQIEASFASLHSSALSQSVQSPQYQAPPQSQHTAFILPEVPDYGQYARDMGGRPQSYAAQRGMPAQASMPGAVCGWAAAQQPMSPHMSSPMPPPSMHQRQPSPMAPPSMHQRQPMPANSPAMYQSRPMQSPMPAWQHSTSPASMQGSPMLAVPPSPMPPPSVHGPAMH